MTIQEKIAVMQAYADGKPVEYRLKDNGSWSESTNLNFNFETCEYRLKSEAKEFWIVDCPNTTPRRQVFPTPHNYKCRQCTVTHVREVIPSR